jgi:predicted enzyme related to lactoylglutathione lyase
MDVGLNATLDFVVTDADTAQSQLSGDLAVLGTPRLVAWLEAATCAVVHERGPYVPSARDRPGWRSRDLPFRAGASSREPTYSGATGRCGVAVRHGSIVFVELPVRDLARAADFYTALFGWQFEPDDTNRHRWLFTPAGMGAMGAITTERAPGPGGARLAVSVHNFRHTVDRVIQLGGGAQGVVTSDLGTHVEIIDPDGNHLWAFESKLGAVSTPGQRSQRA